MSNGCYIFVVWFGLVQVYNGSKREVGKAKAFICYLWVFILLIFSIIESSGLFTFSFEICLGRSDHKWAVVSTSVDVDETLCDMIAFVFWLGHKSIGVLILMRPSTFFKAEIRFPANFNSWNSSFSILFSMLGLATQIGHLIGVQGPLTSSASIHKV